ncbi:hypothetical protein MUK42_25633 [Musa troglodytarum]|uniref:Uncharacterized protein n=1 Tax=Musa troglodytarum TaxID=320322 RepID=A0A9E7FIY8_9LILI|nr:hypothetical protein MUK42_25633 [Musa troglodytarum]
MAMTLGMGTWRRREAPNTAAERFDKELWGVELGEQRTRSWWPLLLQPKWRRQAHGTQREGGRRKEEGGGDEVAHGNLPAVQWEVISSMQQERPWHSGVGAIQRPPVAIITKAADESEEEDSEGRRIPWLKLSEHEADTMVALQHHHDLGPQRAIRRRHEVEAEAKLDAARKLAAVSSFAGALRASAAATAAPTKKGIRLECVCVCVYVSFVTSPSPPPLPEKDHSVNNIVVVVVVFFSRRS